MESLDKIRDTARSHDRTLIVEVPSSCRFLSRLPQVMGRDAGWLALYGGMAGGANVILIPEIPYSLQAIADTIIQRRKVPALPSHVSCCSYDLEQNSFHHHRNC